MAFRRSLTARAKHFYQQQRVALPLSRVDRDDSDRRRQDLQIHGLRRGGGANAGSFTLSGWRNLCGDRRFAAPAAYTPVFVRTMSTNGEGRGAENVAIITDNLEMVNEAAEKAAEGVAPVANDLAAAAMYVFEPLINHVHTFTGCNWCASIALSTILFRTLTLPVMIHQTKAAYKLRSIYGQLWNVREENEKSGNEGSENGNLLVEKIRKEHGASKIIFVTSVITFCVSFMFCTAIFETVRTVDSGAFWFTDLTTPGATSILRVLGGFTFLSTLMIDVGGLNRAAIAAALSFPYTMAFVPKGLLCYWITSNLFGVAYGLVIKNAEVKKMLGIPNKEEPYIPIHNHLVLPPTSHDLIALASAISCTLYS